MSRPRIFDFGKLKLLSDYEKRLTSHSSFESLIVDDATATIEPNYVVIYNCLHSTDKLIYSYACCQGDAASVNKQVDQLRLTNHAVYQVVQFSTCKNAHDLLAYLLYESRSLIDVHGHCFRIRTLPPHEVPINEQDIVRHMKRVYCLSSFYDLNK